MLVALLIISVIFVGGSIALAAPSVFFDPGTQLMPSCAPGTCTVRIIPDGAGNANKFLQVNASGTLVWASSTVSSADITSSNAALLVTGGTGAVLSGVTLDIRTASGSQSGLLSAADWNLFNGKQGALGFTPYNSTNPDGYISFSSIASSTDVDFSLLAAGDFLRYDGNAWVNATLSSGDVPNLDISKITTGSLNWARVTSTPTSLPGYGIVFGSSDVTTALGYTPYNSTNPSGYISSSSIASSTDVSLSSLAAGNFLKYDGNTWVNAALSAGDIPSLDMSKISTGSLSWSRVAGTPTTIAGYGITDPLVNSFNSRTGTVTLTASDVTSTLGYVPYNAANPANYIILTALSAASPLVYSTTTGAFSMQKASSTADGYLSAVDWSTFNGKLATALNSGFLFVGNGSNVAAGVALSGDAVISSNGVLTVTTSAITSEKILDATILNIDLATSSFSTSLGTTGTDVNFSAAGTVLGGTLVLNIPNAGAAARGLVSTGTQSIAGNKSFLGTVGIGTTTPASALHVIGKVTASAGFNGQCVSALTFALAGGNTCNQDVAEVYPTFEPTEPGDVVAIPPAGSEATGDGNSIARIGRSQGAAGERVLGVVSANPGLLFNNGLTYLAGPNDQFVSPTSTVVALAGRVAVKVSLENGPIAVGDELAASASEPGVAIRAPGPGPVIGVALQAYPPESGAAAAATNIPAILMFVDLHWSLGNTASGDQIVSNTAGFGQFAEYVKEVLHGLGVSIANGIVTIQDLFADKITTHELCLDDVCVGKEQLLQLIRQAPAVSLPAPEAQPQPAIDTLPSSEEESSAEEPAGVVGAEQQEGNAQNEAAPDVSATNESPQGETAPDENSAANEN